MNEWRELTGDALNFYVAERRGDVVKHWDEATIDRYESRGQTKYGDWLEHWIEDAEEYAHPVPNVAGDANEALALPLEEGAGFELHTYGQSADARVCVYVSSRLIEAEPQWEHVAGKHAASIALTMAWLRYMDAKEGVK